MRLVNPLTGETTNAFCPTGEGGGIDPTCPPKKGMTTRAIEAALIEDGWNTETMELTGVVGKIVRGGQKGGMQGQRSALLAMDMKPESADRIMASIEKHYQRLWKEENPDD